MTDDGKPHLLKTIRPVDRVDPTPGRPKSAISIRPAEQPEPTPGKPLHPARKTPTRD